MELLYTRIKLFWISISILGISGPRLTPMAAPHSPGRASPWLGFHGFPLGFPKFSGDLGVGIQKERVSSLKFHLFGFWVQIHPWQAAFFYSFFRSCLQFEIHPTTTQHFQDGTQQVFLGHCSPTRKALWTWYKERWDKGGIEEWWMRRWSQYSQRFRWFQTSKG